MRYTARRNVRPRREDLPLGFANPSVPDVATQRLRSFIEANESLSRLAQEPRLSITEGQTDLLADVVAVEAGFLAAYPSDTDGV
jgi:hypothetical protein